MENFGHSMLAGTGLGKQNHAHQPAFDQTAYNIAVQEDLKMLRDRQHALAVWCICASISSILLAIAAVALKLHS